MSAGVLPEVRLGNDIARQFGHLDDRGAVEQITAHIAKFWTPAMTRHLKTAVAAADPDVDPLLAAAAAALVATDIEDAEFQHPSGG